MGGGHLYRGEAIPHFNEVDECAGLDGLLTHRVHKAMGQPVENTLHDIRWGDWDQSGSVKDYVWVFLISGAAPPAHFRWLEICRRASSASNVFPQWWQHPARHFQARARLSGREFTSKAGRLKMDLGRAGVVELPREETERRWNETTYQWPIMHAVTYGMTRDQLMGRHKSNHIQVAYAN